MRQWAWWWGLGVVLLCMAASPAEAQISAKANRNLERLDFGVTGLATRLCDNDATPDCALVDDAGNLFVTLGTNILESAGDDIGIGKITPDSGLALAAPVTGVITTGDNTIVTGTGGQTVRVYEIDLQAGAASTITVKCGSTTVHGARPFAANEGWVKSLRPDYIYACADGEAFVLTVTGSTTYYVRYTKG